MWTAETPAARHSTRGGPVSIRVVFGWSNDCIHWRQYDGSLSKGCHRPRTGRAPRAICQLAIITEIGNHRTVERFGEFTLPTSLLRRIRACRVRPRRADRPRPAAARRAGSFRRSSSAAAQTRSAESACMARAVLRQCARISAASSRDGLKPAASVTNAFGTACRSGSGLGTTAASATAGCSISTLSSSNGLIR